MAAAAAPVAFTPLGSADFAAWLDAHGADFWRCAAPAAAAAGARGVARGGEGDGEGLGVGSEGDEGGRIARSARQQPRRRLRVRREDGGDANGPEYVVVGRRRYRRIANERLLLDLCGGPDALSAADIAGLFAPPPFGEDRRSESAFARAARNEATSDPAAWDDLLARAPAGEGAGARERGGEPRGERGAAARARAGWRRVPRASRAALRDAMRAADAAELAAWLTLEEHMRALASGGGGADANAVGGGNEDGGMDGRGGVGSADEGATSGVDRPVVCGERARADAHTHTERIGCAAGDGLYFDVQELRDGGGGGGGRVLRICDGVGSAYRRLLVHAMASYHALASVTEREAVPRGGTGGGGDGATMRLTGRASDGGRSGFSGGGGGGIGGSGCAAAATPPLLPVLAGLCEV